MLKMYPADNLMELMSRISLASFDQLTYFFRDVLDGPAAVNMVEDALRSHSLIENTEENYVQKFRGPIVRRDVAYDMVKAFWVIAKFGSSQIKSIAEGEYPTQYIFISEDNRPFDITVVDSLEKAGYAAMVRATANVKDYQDICVHIAVIDNPELIAPLEKLGFDVFFSVDMEDCTVTRLGES